MTYFPSRLHVDRSGTVEILGITVRQKDDMTATGYAAHHDINWARRSHQDTVFGKHEGQASH